MRKLLIGMLRSPIPGDQVILYNLTIGGFRLKLGLDNLVLGIRR